MWEGRGPGGGAKLSLRLRLLLAAIGIVVVSLALSGVLTGVLLAKLEFSNAQEQLARSALSYRLPILRSECTTLLANGNCPPGRRVALAQFQDNLRQDVPDFNLRGDRLIVLGKATRATPTPRVVFDSDGTLPVGEALGVGSPANRISGDFVAERTVNIGGTPYLVATAQLTGITNAGYVVVARPRQTVADKATSDLLPLILQAAGAALLLALVVSPLISRALTRPLSELQSAAEDIARGNYSRRVALTGKDEMGVVGQAFNRMAEAVERTRTQQRDFLANVSHELKTPLTSLIGFSQALMDGSLNSPTEKERAVTILHEEAQRVLRMSQELLDLARVEAGQLTLDPQPVDLAAQLEQEIELVRPRARARGLKLDLRLPSVLPPVRADPERLHQILENLLDNAVKYAPERSEVTIWAAAEDSRVETMVRNQVGAHPPDPERMFERFYRADPSRSSAAPGAGLGLAISRHLATAQHGALAAKLDSNHLVVRLEMPTANGTNSLPLGRG